VGYSLNNGFILTIYKEIKNINTKRTSDTTSRRGKKLNRQYLKEHTQMVNKYKKKQSTFLVIKKLKMILSHPLEWLSSNHNNEKQSMTNNGKDDWGGEVLYTIGGNAKCSPYENEYETSSYN
jgi:hypothetical protein